MTDWVQNFLLYGTTTNRTAVYDYDTANKWVTGGKTPGHRHVYYGSSSVAAMRKDMSSADNPVYLFAYGPYSNPYYQSHYIPLISWDKDGLVYLYNQGQSTHTCPALRNLVSKFIPGIRVQVQHKQLMLLSPACVKTQLKKSRCRQCSGLGRIPTMCWVSPESGMCVCGFFENQKSYKRTFTCFNCNGECFKEYGGKIKGVAWNGERIAIDSHYNIYSLDVLGKKGNLLSPGISPTE